MSAAESLDAPGWTLRPFDASGDDENALMYLLGVSYARSKAGRRAKAEGAGRSAGSVQGRAPTQDEIAAQRAFLDAHRPLWHWLLSNADVLLAVDALDPETIWGWAVTSEPNVVHAVGVKRTAVEHGLAVDIVRDLLGSRLDSHQVCTLELPQLATRGRDVIGIDRPKPWSMDPTWLGFRGAFQR